jgi:hypothetical protein
VHHAAVGLHQPHVPAVALDDDVDEVRSTGGKGAGRGGRGRGARSGRGRDRDARARGQERRQLSRDVGGRRAVGPGADHQITAAGGERERHQRPHAAILRPSADRDALPRVPRPAMARGTTAERGGERPALDAREHRGTLTVEGRT